MKSVKAFSFFLIGLVIVGSLSMAKPAFAVTPEEVTQISERLESDSGALAATAELAGADSELFGKFQTGVKYGEFASRLWQGDYWGVAVDFVKFKLGEEWDELTDYATEKAFSKGAQRLLGAFTALKDLGEWIGNKALDTQYSIGVKEGYDSYKVVEGDRAFMEGWWTIHGKGKLENVGTFDDWMKKFAKVYASQKQVEEKPIAPEEIAKVQKVIKKSAVISFFKIQYSGIGDNVAEELAEAIVNKDSSAIKAIAEKYKKHLDALTAAGAKSDAVSSSDICGKIKVNMKYEEDRRYLYLEESKKRCLKILNDIIERRREITSNKIAYEGLGVIDSIDWKNIRNDGVEAEFKAFIKSQTKIIADAHESMFGNEIKAINVSLTATKGQFDSLKSDYKNLPKQGDHWRVPSYKVSVNTGFTRVFNNVYNKVFNYGSFQYYDFKNEAAQKYYQEYLENEPKANAVDDIRERYLKAHLGRANVLVRDFTFLQSRINSLISSAESATGVFSYGQVTIDDLKKMVSEVEELKKDVQSGEKEWWSFWGGRDGAWSIDSASEAIKGMEGDKKERESSINQLKKDYASALKTYENEEKQRKLEEQKQAEEEKKAVAEKEARDLKEKKAEEDAVKQERALQEAEKQAAAEKVRLELEQRTKAFNVPFGESQKTTSDKVTPPTPTVAPKTVTPQTKPTPLPTQPLVQPPAQTKSTLPSGYSGIPNENEEIAGFSFITQGKADMMISDFFWVDGTGIYTVNGALDLGIKTIDVVTSVPASGYKEDPYQPEVGHVYAIKTRDGKYGIIQIDQIRKAHIYAEGYHLYFFWRYQPDGSTSFK